MRTYQSLQAFIACFLYQFINTIFATKSELTVIDEVSVNRSGSIRVDYNYSKHPFSVKNCKNIQGNFYVDTRGHSHNESDSQSISATSIDYWSFSVNQLTSMFRTTLDLSQMTADCVIDTASSYLNQALYCNNSRGDLGVYYNSAHPLRNGTVTVSNSHGELIFCESSNNGFFITGFQSDLSPQHSISPNPTSILNAEEPDFNPLWLIPIIGGTLLVFAGIAIVSHRLKSSLFSCPKESVTTEGTPLLKVDESASTFSN